MICSQVTGLILAQLTDKGPTFDLVYKSYSVRFKKQLLQPKLKFGRIPAPTSNFHSLCFYCWLSYQLNSKSYWQMQCMWGPQKWAVWSWWMYQVNAQYCKKFHYSRCCLWNKNFKLVCNPSWIQTTNSKKKKKECHTRVFPTNAWCSSRIKFIIINQWSVFFVLSALLMVVFKLWLDLRQPMDLVHGPGPWIWVSLLHGMTQCSCTWVTNWVVSKIEFCES